MLLPNTFGQQWVFQLTGVISNVVFLLSLTIAVWAFVHCAIQRGDAFSAVGTLSKGVWLLLIGGTLLLAFVFYPVLGGLLGLVSLTASLIYLLDIRPAIKDLTQGR